jgi:D-3-phosphoglycerate dehydrogenase / 2-oxoglutarate reductase
MRPLVWIIDEEWPDYELEQRLLKERYPECGIRFSTYDYQRDLDHFGAEADAILCQIYARFTEESLSRLARCRGIAVYGGGYDRIDVAAARKRGISVTNVSDYCREDLADYVMAAIYHCNKRLLGSQKEMEQGQWGARAVPARVRRLRGATLLVIGLGRIGKVVAQKGRALGMMVVSYDPYVDEATMAGLGVAKVAWEEGLGQADFISVNAILTSETQGLIKYDDFVRMKPTAYLVNTARGRIIVEKDLIRALREQRLAGAVLDVIETEPPTLDEAIFRCPNVLVTPHISYISEESYAELKRRTVENAIQMLEGAVPADLVN